MLQLKLSLNLINGAWCGRGPLVSLALVRSRTFLVAVDAAPYGSLGVNTASIVKQGILPVAMRQKRPRMRRRDV
jgi:hypothetical protein